MLDLIAKQKRTYDEVSAFTDFVKTAALVMTSANPREAIERAGEIGLGDRAMRVLKAAQAGGTVGNAGVVNFGAQLGALMSSLRNIGAFDTIAAAAMKLPLRLGRVVIASGFTVSTVGEGVAKPVRPIVLQASDMTPAKVACVIVLTKELIDALGVEGLNILGRELRGSIGQASDAGFLAALTGNSSEAEGSDVDSFASFLDAFEEGLRLLNLGAGSRVFAIMTPENMKSVAVQAYGAGVATLGWNGGELAGVEFVVSDAQSADRLTLVDASGLAVALGEITLKASDEALVQMDTAPSMESTTPTATQGVSMFQTNSRALMCEREFSIKAIRVASYAHLTGIALGQDSGSPAGI